MNAEEEFSTNIAEKLLAACKTHDASTFTRICGRLKDAKEERKSVGEHLVAIMRERNASQAEAAINSLMFSGIAWEADWPDRLLQIAQEMFTADVLKRLAKEEELRLVRKRDCQRISSELRLLRSMIYVATRENAMRGAAFVEFVEAEVVLTPLASKIARWKA